MCVGAHLCKAKQRLILTGFIGPGGNVLYRKTGRIKCVLLAWKGKVKGDRRTTNKGESFLNVFTETENGWMRQFTLNPID